VALQAYFDGSRTDGQSMTLAAIAADEPIWQDIEDQWRTVLKIGGNAPYCHMKEAMALQGAFEGWTPKDRDFLLHGLASLLSEFGAKPRFSSFTCTVDLDAHRRWKKVNRIPPPEKLCTRSVLPRILDWYAGFPEPIVDAVELFFDRNEKFMGHVLKDWNNKKIRRLQPVWDLIRQVAELEMRRSPAVQMADMIAWSRNRLAPPPIGNSLALKPSTVVNDQFDVLASLIFNTARMRSPQIHHVEIGEQLIATRKFREELN
jgi:hypothetical protein